MDRRGFLTSGLAAGAAVWPGTPSDASDVIVQETDKRTEDLGINAIPIFCSHEHWGSINSIGQVAEGFRADVYAGATKDHAAGLDRGSLFRRVPAWHGRKS